METVNITRYFRDKLKAVSQKIKSLEKAILSSATNKEYKDMDAQVANIQKFEAIKSEYIKDLVKYCSVKDVVELGCEKISPYSEECYIKGDQKAVERLSYVYRFSDKPITVQERNLLVNSFGYPLKDAKV